MMDGINYHDEMCKRMMNPNYEHDKQIRADVIEKCAKVVSSMVGICQSSCPIDCEWGTEESCIESWKIYLTEQLKEQNNE